MLRFLIENGRWLGAGLLLSFGSAFGQTYFISLFAGEIRAGYGLTNGEWGLLYTLATVASAGLLLGRGAWADTVPLSRLAPLVTLVYAGAAALMVVGQADWVLALAVFLLRFCGQGMFTHMMVTAMARWFVARRGRAVAIAGFGHPLGEILLPLPVVLAIGWIGFRWTWGIVVVALLLLVLPALMALLRDDRAPVGQAGAEGAPGLGGRHWTRGEMLRHWLFWALLPLILTPGFIGTVVFFHQVHMAEVKGWSLALMAPGYTTFAITTVAMGLAAGFLVDRFGPARLLPVAVLPMAAGIALMGEAESEAGWIVALTVIGISQGMSGTLWATMLPWAYGTDHIGAIRAVAVAAMVASTAIGPGVTGFAIDLGVDFPGQTGAMALWCIAISVAMWPVMRRITRPASATA